MGDADSIYNTILSGVAHRILGDKTTYLSDLDKVGRQMFGNKFHGVYPSDKIPILTKAKPYAILNLDRSGMSGSHWISIARQGKFTYVYDSFGRESTQIIRDLVYSGNGKIVDTEYDAEQLESEDDCGARSIAWLLVFDLYGAKLALEI
jgi:hypothetical protein